MSAGKRFRDALETERPLQVVGAINAYAALLAERAGFRALYLSGAGVANHSLGLPDLGMIQLDDVLTEADRITAVIRSASVSTSSSWIIPRSGSPSEWLATPAPDR